MAADRNGEQEVQMVACRTDDRMRGCQHAELKTGDVDGGRLN
jgi:hypothetical protein